MNARVLTGALLAVSVVIGGAYTVLHTGKAAAATGKTAPVPAPGAPLAGAADGRGLAVGTATSWPTVTPVDTGAADWTYNPAGWDYAVIGVRGGR